MLENGVAERSNGLIAERARAMVINTGAPRQLWPEAIKAACYLLNRSPSKATNWKISAQLWYESMYADSEAQPTDLGHIRVWGCKAYAHIPEERRVKSAKFNERSEEGMLVGYEGSNIYRIWLPNKEKVVRR